MSRSYLALASCALFAFFSLLGCSDPNSSQLDTTKLALPMEDSPEARHAQALRVIAAYPMEEWERDILRRIRSITGSEASEEVEALVQRRLNAKDLLEKRLSLMTASYTASDLAQLAELYATPQGKRLLGAFIGHDERLREQLAPLIAEALSGDR